MRVDGSVAAIFGHSSCGRVFADLKALGPANAESQSVDVEAASL